jgi:type III secretion system needle length determinant
MKDASPFTKDGQPLTNENARNAAKDSNPLPKGGNDLPKGGQKTEADASKERNPPAGMSPGDSILMGLHQGAARPENIQNVTPSAPIQTVAQTNGELLTRLADRILVSAPDAGGPREVRLMLREEVLPGTEIRIQRQPDGNVSVQFVTNDVRAEQLLGVSQLNDLQSVLTRGLHVDVRVVTVRPDGGLTAEAGGQSDSGGGQNRGQHGGQGQPGDGRSRQHDIFEGLHEDNA